MKLIIFFRERFLPLFLTLTGIFVVSSCAVTDKPALDLSPMTLPPPPTSVFEGNCDDIETLETWLQTVDFQKREFIRLMNEGVAETTEGLYFDVEQMARLRDRVASLVVPDCAAEAHLLLLNSMGDVLQVYQAAVNGELVDLESTIDENTSRFQVFDGLQADLMQRLNAS